jgi:HAMP domain-containing protein
MDQTYAAANIDPRYLDNAKEVPEEVRPLERIASFADDVSFLGGELAQYLERFNGPRPAEIVGRSETARPPSTYRTEIERLEANIANMRQLVNQIGRLG